MADNITEIEEEEYTSQLTAPVFKRIVGLVAPYWKWVVGFAVTILMVSILDAYFTFINKNIVDMGINMKDSETVMRLAGTYGSFILVQAVMVFTCIYLAGVLGERVQYDLRRKMFNHLQDLSLSYYSQMAVGRLMARVTSDSGASQSW